MSPVLDPMVVDIRRAVAAIVRSQRPELRERLRGQDWSVRLAAEAYVVTIDGTDVASIDLDVVAAAVALFRAKRDAPALLN